MPRPGPGPGRRPSFRRWCRSVVAPPLAALEAVRGTGDCAVGRAPTLDDLVVLDALLVGAGRRAGRGAAGCLLRDPGPTAAVEPDTEQQFARWDALALQLGYRIAAVE